MINQLHLLFEYLKYIATVYKKRSQKKIRIRYITVLFKTLYPLNMQPNRWVMYRVLINTYNKTGKTQSWRWDIML